MHDLIEYIANWIVDDEDSVSVQESTQNNRPIIRLEVAELNMGRVIGREGRLASAMRTLLHVSGQIRDQQTSLEIR